MSKSRITICVIFFHFLYRNLAKFNLKILAKIFKFRLGEKNQIVNFFIEKWWNFPPPKKKTNDYNKNQIKSNDIIIAKKLGRNFSKATKSVPKFLYKNFILI
jgi:hypothetical protein